MTILAGQVIRASDFNDTGVQTLDITAGTGWTEVTSTYHQFGPMMTIFVEIERTGATITGPANGDITNSTMATIDNAAQRPDQAMWTGNSAAGSMGFCRINTDGVILLTALHVAANIDSGDTVAISATYMVAT